MSKYIAYGSNLNMAQMAVRCPGAKVIGSGYLNNWELIYRGSKTGSYATIRRKKGSIVPIGLWEVSEKNEKALDRYEGYPTFYTKENVYVTMQDGSKRKGMVYIMRRNAKPGRPSDYYVSVCRKGYRDFYLDEAYLNQSLEFNKSEL